MASLVIAPSAENDLNVAGPRESKSTGIQSLTRQFVSDVLNGMLEDV